MLVIEKGSFQYSQPVFKDISLNLPDSSLVCIHGKSGCGKTTLLKLLSCELFFQEGRILYDGNEMTKMNQDDYLFNHVSYIDQDGGFFPNMTIKQHYYFYATLHGLDVSDEIIEKSLKSVYLNDINTKKHPDYLSVGQRKRFLIALALFVGKDIILLDEPTASLDQKNKENLLEVIKHVSTDHLIICSSHDSLLVESADITYKIEDYQIKIDHKKSLNIQGTKQNKDIQKPQKVKYYKYKNMKLRFLYMIIFMIGIFATCFISYLITNNMMANINLNEQSNSEENMGLVFYKNTDARWITFSSPDFVEDSEIEKLENVKGVKKVVPYYALGGVKQGPDNYFHISNHQGKSIDVSSYWSKNTKLNGIEWYANVGIFSYDSSQHIKIDGKEINGVYIDEEFAEILGDHLEVGDQLSYNPYIPTKYIEVYSQASDMKDEARTYSDNGEFTPVSFQISGVMPESVYSDEYTSINKADFVRIYVPVEQVQELLKQHAEKGFKHIYDHPMTYLILCEEGMKSQIKIDIESMNELYHADYQGGAANIVVSDSQFNGILFLSGVVLVVGVILLIVYFVNGRKKEIEMLRREGLSHFLRKYYSVDFIRLIIAWFVLSGLSCYVYVQLLALSTEMMFLIMVWMVTSMTVIGLMLLSFEMYLSYIIKRKEEYI